MLSARLNLNLSREHVPDVVDGQRRQSVLPSVKSERRGARHDEHHLDVRGLALVELERRLIFLLTGFNWIITD